MVVVHNTILLVGVFVISWVFAWLPALWCGLSTFAKVIPPVWQIPTILVPITEILSQGLGVYGMAVSNLSVIGHIAFVVQSIAFPLWTYTFLGLQSKLLSIILALITLTGASIMAITSSQWLWFLPLILHKAYDVYWTLLAEFI